MNSIVLENGNQRAIINNSRDGLCLLQIVLHPDVTIHFHGLNGNLMDVTGNQDIPVDLNINNTFTAYDVIATCWQLINDNFDGIVIDNRLVALAQFVITNIEINPDAECVILHAMVSFLENIVEGQALNAVLSQIDIAVNNDDYDDDDDDDYDDVVDVDNDNDNDDNNDNNDNDNDNDNDDDNNDNNNDNYNDDDDNYHDHNNENNDDDDYDDNGDGHDNNEGNRIFDPFGLNFNFNPFNMFYNNHNNHHYDYYNDDGYDYGYENNGILPLSGGFNQHNQYYYQHNPDYSEHDGYNTGLCPIFEPA